MNIDIISRPGEAFLKCISFVTLGHFMDLDITTIHLPPIFIEVARFFAYMGAGVAFFRFVIGIFSKKTDKPLDNEDKPKEL